MGYASAADVKTRAGMLRGRFGQSGAPDDDEINAVADEISGLVDAKLGALSLSTPVTDSRAVAALRGIVADGTLLTVLPAAYPSDAGAAAAQELISTVQKRFDTAMSALDSGSSSIVALLLSLVASGVSDAGDFWSDHPRWEIERVPEELLVSPSVLPAIRKGSKL